MFRFSIATRFLQGSTRRTWSCVTDLATLVWNKFNHITQISMPRSRKRHHSRSRSKTRSRSPSRDLSVEKQKKPGSHEKDGKRRRLDEVIDSPQQKRSLSSSEDESMNKDRSPNVVELPKDSPKKSMEVDNENNGGNTENEDCAIVEEGCAIIELNEDDEKETVVTPTKSVKASSDNKSDLTEEAGNDTKADNNITPDKDEVVTPTKSLKASDIKSDLTEEAGNDTKADNNITPDKDEVIDVDAYSAQRKERLTTPKKPMTPKQLQKRMESEKKKQQKQKEREEREKQRNEEKAKIIAEKQKIKEQKEAEKRKMLEDKQKQLELKQKEKELKEEQKKKEKDEKEQKRKEREQMEAQKRKERLKKIQELESKNKEKQKEEEKKQKTVALFVNFFKKAEPAEKEKKLNKVNCNFMPFQVKSDMKLPSLRRTPLSPKQVKELDCAIKNQDSRASYLKDLQSGKTCPGRSPRTWPYEDPEEEVTIIEEDKNLGETISENTSIRPKMKAKLLSFHDNRRPAYFGTWRKKSKFITGRKPFGEDTGHFNYEEDSDDDWEEEEQGESLDISGGEDEKDTENDADEYEVDNEFFVPHGHLSDDEVDDEENARLSPESFKQKLKLLKAEFDQEIKSKTSKLKSRCIGGFWLNAQGDSVDNAIYRYLQPFAMIVRGPIEIKKRPNIFAASPSVKPDKKKVKPYAELPIDHIPFFLKIIHGNVNKKTTVIEEFLTFMTHNGFSVDASKSSLIRFIQQCATYKRCQENGPMKNKFGWFVNDDVIEKYNLSLDLHI